MPSHLQSLIGFPGLHGLGAVAESISSMADSPQSLREETTFF
jgi:hypothetical protein